jgi:hypothetical protein
VFGGHNLIEGSFSVVTGHDRIQPIALGTRGLNHRETMVSALVSALVSAFGIALLSPLLL